MEERRLMLMETKDQATKPDGFECLNGQEEGVRGNLLLVFEACLSVVRSFLVVDPIAIGTFPVPSIYSGFTVIDARL